MEIIRQVWEGLERAFEAVEQLIADALGVITEIMVVVADSEILKTAKKVDDFFLGLC